MKKSVRNTIAAGAALAAYGTGAAIHHEMTTPEQTVSSCAGYTPHNMSRVRVAALGKAINDFWASQPQG